MMIDAKDLINGVRESLSEDGFIPFEKIKLGIRPEKGLTLHEAIRKTLQMKPDDSYYMYWEWRELQHCFNQFWLAMDDAASQVSGRKTSAIAFAGIETAVFPDVLQMLDIVKSEEIPIFPSPRRRPAASEAQVRFVGKLYGACLQTIASLSTNSKMEYGKIFSLLSDESLSDESLLAKVDDMCLENVDNRELLVKSKTVVIVRAFGFAHQVTNQLREKESLKSYTVSEFLYATNKSQPWIELSEVQVLQRLLEIAPEKAEGPLKAIVKFFSE